MRINFSSEVNRIADLPVLPVAACPWACGRLLDSKSRPDPPGEPRS